MPCYWVKPAHTTEFWATDRSCSRWSSRAVSDPPAPCPDGSEPAPLTARHSHEPGMDSCRQNCTQYESDLNFRIWNQHLWLQGILMNLGWICVIKTAHSIKVTWILESWPWTASDRPRKQYWNRSTWSLCSYLKMKKGKRKLVFHKLTCSELQIIVCLLIAFI